MTKDTRVACLYRVSTKKQVEENDIPMQKNACGEFISRRDNWRLVNEYYEKGVSGYHKSAEQRDILQQVKKDAESKKFDVLLVFMFDRLGRREDETPFVVEWFVEQGIEVWSVKEGQQRFDNRSDKLINYIRYWQSSGESEKTGMRVKEKHKQMVEAGQYRGGSPPYGYHLVVSENKNRKGYNLKMLEIDNCESKVVKEIFALATEHGYGGHRIAKFLNEKNIKTKRGNYWTTDTIMTLLKNPVYKGYYVSGKRQSKRGERIRTTPENWIYSHEIIPELVIVDEKIWSKAEDIRNSRRKDTGKYPKQTKGPLLLVGLARCGGCGTIMASRYALKKWTRKTDNQEKQFLQPKYICQRKNAKVLCKGQRTFSQSKVDPVVLEEVYLYLDSLAKIDLSEKIYDMQDNMVNVTQQNWHSVKKVIVETEAEMNILNDEIIKCLKGESNFTTEQLLKIMNRKESDIEDLIRKEKQIRIELDANQSNVKQFIELQQMIPEWKNEFKEAPIDMQKMLLAKLIDSVYIFKDRIEVNFKFDLYEL